MRPVSVAGSALLQNISERQEIGNSDPIDQIVQSNSQQERCPRTYEPNLSQDDQVPGHRWDPTNIHEWQPERWRPTAVIPDMFRLGPCSFIPHWIDGGKVGYPALLFNWDLFRCLLRNAWVTREYKAADAFRQEERRRIFAIQEKLLADRRYRERQLMSRRNRYWRAPQTYEQRRLEEEKFENRVDEDDALYNKLSTEVRDLDVKCRKAMDRVEHPHDELMPLLDKLFGQMGALPDFNELEPSVQVPVFERWNKEGDAALEWPENTWNDVESAWSDSPPHP